MIEDLIKRSDAIKAVEDGMCTFYDCDVLDRINAIPSTDRPQGKWISNHDGSWNCSECGLRVFIYAKGNYCPNCGADMTEREDE